jgi:hypothetical protein|tara:strand:+ start:4135 stop:4824 length:690 start_codon:yes stop_codon:yes gene_type:complete
MYSRESPSEEYKELVSEYVDLHENGSKEIPAEKMFNGISLVNYLPDLMDIVRVKEQAKSILDYGCGKGLLYSPTKFKNLRLDSKGRKLKDSLPNLWQLDYYDLYDPGYKEHNKLPKGKYDGVICTDVIEHIDNNDCDWILNEIFSYSRNFVYVTIACYKALKTFSNGKNVHVNIQTPEYWKEKLNKLHEKYLHLNVYLVLDILIDDKRDANYGKWKSIHHTIERKDVSV